MRKINIPHFKKGISILGLGTMIFNTSSKKKLAFELMDHFVKNGGNLIDTAEIYGDPEEYGYSETVIGQWLHSRNCRDDVVILTKGCIPGTCFPLHKGGSEISPSGIQNAIEGSLKRLRVDYVDIWMLHRDDPEVPVSKIIETLNDEVSAGRIHVFGASNWTVSRINEANQYAKENGLIGFSCTSPNFSLAVAKEPYWPGTVITTKEDRRWYEKHNFPLFAWSSLGRGFFSKGSRDFKEDPELMRVFYSDENFYRKERAHKLAKIKGVKAIEIALAYINNQKFPTCALMGPSSISELESCIISSRITLNENELQYLELTIDGID